MAINLKPLNWNWDAVTTGDTYPAINIVETSSDSALTRARVTVKASGSAVASLTLDSDATGVTINVATAGAWDFTIDEINPVTLTTGWYNYDLETTDAAGVISTEFKGTWQILSETTD